MVNYTISDLLTRIRNANMIYKASVSVPKTKLHEKLCDILQREGFIEKFQVPETDSTELLIYLKYKKVFAHGDGGLGKPCITNLQRISKPGLRIYTNHKDIPKILGGMGIVILSTSKGLMTDREARRSRVGGEIICSVW